MRRAQVEVFLPLVKGAPDLSNRRFAAALNACAHDPGARQAEKGIPLGSERDEALAAKVERLRKSETDFIDCRGWQAIKIWGLS